MRYWKLSFVLKCFLVLCYPNYVVSESASNCQVFILASVLGTFAASLLVFTVVGCLIIQQYRRTGKSEHFARAIVLSKDQLVEDGYDQRANNPSPSGDHVISNESVVPIDDAPQLHTAACKTHSQTSMKTIQLSQGLSNGSFGIRFGIAGLFIKEVTNACNIVGNGYRLKPGDEVTSINGISLDGMSDQQASDILVRAGKTVALEIRYGVFLHKVNNGTPLVNSLKTSFRDGSPNSNYTRASESPAANSGTKNLSQSSLLFNEETGTDHRKAKFGMEMKNNTKPSVYHNPPSNLIASASMPSLNLTSNDERFISYQRQRSPVMTSSADCLTTKETIDENSNSLRSKRKTNRRDRSQKASSAIYSNDVRAAKHQHMNQPFDVHLSRSRFPAPPTSIKADVNDTNGNPLLASSDRSDFTRLAIANDNNPLNLATPPSPGDDASALAFAMSVAKMRQAAAAMPLSSYFNRYRDQVDHYTSIELDPDVMREMTAKYCEPRFPLANTTTSGENTSHANTSSNVVDRHVNGVDGAHPQQRYQGSNSLELDTVDRERFIYRKSLSNTQNGNGSPNGSQEGVAYEKHHGLSMSSELERPRSYSSNHDNGGVADTLTKRHRSSTSLAASPPVRRRTMKIANPRSASFLKPRRQPKRAHSLPPRQDGNTSHAVKVATGPSHNTNQSMFDTLDSINRRKSIDSGTLKKLHGELKANPLLCNEYPIIAQLLGHAQLTNAVSDPSDNDDHDLGSYHC